MKLITHEQRTTMLANSKLYDSDPDFDLVPVVKIFSPVGAATWLLCCLDRGDPDIAEGLCDLGFGCPEIGSVRISALESVVLPVGLRLERDLYFKPSKTLSQYADDARVGAASMREVRHAHSCPPGAQGRTTRRQPPRCSARCHGSGDATTTVPSGPGQVPTTIALEKHPTPHHQVKYLARTAMN